MKYILFGLGLLIIVYSCGPSKAEIEAHPELYNNTTKAVEFSRASENYSIFKIGDCEYIKGWGGAHDGGPYVTHKGDCSNPIHIYKTDSL